MLNVFKAVDMVRLSKEKQSTETLTSGQSSRKLEMSNPKLPCYSVPYGLNMRFFGRSDEVGRMKTILDPVEPRAQMRVLAIHGLGGVGKTQLALHYANTSLRSYSMIAWIPTENQATFSHALSNLAVKLGLVEEGAHNDYRSMQMVRDWLNTTDTPFLLIFDNVADNSLLEQIWPATAEASVVITTRSPSVAAQRTTSIMDLQSFQGENANAVLYILAGTAPSGEEEKAAATEICRLLGGLPLALAQISAFIRDRRCSYQELLHLYKKSTEEVFDRSELSTEYDKPLLTTWDMSIRRLSPQATTLLHVLAFFDSNGVPECLIMDSQAKIDESPLAFLFDEFDFGDAVMELIKASLVSRLITSKSLTIHRLVKLVVLSKISAKDKAIYFGEIVKILTYDFPNTWNQCDPYYGHVYKPQETCGAIIPHVRSLMAISKEFGINASQPEDWAELLFRSGTYIWEKEQPILAQEFFELGLGLRINPSSLIAAHAYRILGHTLLDTARPNAALRTYEKALTILQRLEGPKYPLVADIYGSIACAHVEAGRITDAFEYVGKATAIHCAHGTAGMARTEAIGSLTYLRAGQANKSLEALRRCWELRGFGLEQVAGFQDPEYSRDIMLLARVRWQQGRIADAMELALRVATIRRGAFNKHSGPRVVDSEFILGTILREKGEDMLTAKLLRTIIKKSRETIEMRAHLARALWFLANIEEKIGNHSSAVDLRKEAKEVRSQIKNREGEDVDSDEGFMKLVSWMLW